MRQVLLKNMKGGEVYRDHYIKLEIISSSVKLMTSVMVVVEDNEGSFTELALYNLFKSEDLSRESKYTIAEKILAKGTKIIIREPFFKVRQDGTLGIRVDNPKDLIFDQNLKGPSSFSEWKSEGNRLFLQKLPQHAMRCYVSALQCLASDDSMIYLMLLNLSLCFLKLKQYQVSLLFSFASIIIGRLSSLRDYKLMLKAYHRFFEASVALDQRPIADWSSQQIKAIDFSFWTRTIKFKCTQGSCFESSQELWDHLPLEAVLSTVTPCLVSLIDQDQRAIVQPTVDCKSLKESATKQFQEGDFSGALSNYMAILTSSKASSDWSTILSNMSACSSEHPHQRSLAALASLCICSGSEKALYRLSE